MTLKLSGGARQRILYVSPPKPRAVVVMLPGGAGDVGIEQDGDLRHENNFVVRTRGLWVARGYAVLIPDAVDHDNLRGLRRSPRYAALVADLVAYAHAQAPAPVFLLGTSQGSIAAMNGASHLRRGQIAGLVLTESGSRLGASGETVFDAHPDQVEAPVLIVADRDDQCDITPPQDAPKIAAALSHAAQVQVLTVNGGIQRSAKPCGSLSPHGYYGIEAPVIAAIAAWMDRLRFASSPT